MTEKEYRAHPAISRSQLWKMDGSPEKFKYEIDHPTPQMPALLFGQVVHKLLLLPEEFDTEFAVAPSIDRRTKAGKEAYNGFLAANEGKIIVPEDMLLQAREMVEKVMEDRSIASLLSGAKELPFFWTDEMTGVSCKCRPDCLTYLDGEDAPTLIDYKTTSNARTDIFNNEIYKYGYHFQAAMYTEGVMSAMDLSERPEFIFIAQEKKPPYAVNVITVPPEVMLAGLDKYRELIGKYNECVQTDYWYGYRGPFGEPNEAYLPGWMQLGVEQEDEE